MYLKNYVLPYLLIIRPGICIGSAILVVLSTLTADPNNFDLAKALLASTGVALSIGAGFAINDLFDRRIDVITNPQRALPKQLFGTKEVLTYYFVLLSTATLAFAFVGITISMVGVLCNLALYIYSWKLREINGLLSNITVALLVATMLSFGALVVGKINDRIVILFIFWFLVTLTREILGDIRDIEGDKINRKLRTLPLTVGIRNSLWIAASILLTSALFSISALMTTRAFPNSFYGFTVSLVYFLFVRIALLKLIRDGNVAPAQDILKGALFLYPLAVVVSTFLF